MTNEERVLRTIKRQSIDYLSSQITFSDISREKELSRSFGFSEVEEFRDYLDNHLYYTFSLEYAPLRYRDDINVLEYCQRAGYAKIDIKNSIVYDNWGMGTFMDSDGFSLSFSPLKDKPDDNIRRYMPDAFPDSIFNMNLYDAIRAYPVPDPSRPEGYSMIKRELCEYSGRYLVVASGNWGIIEHAYGIMGFENFMIETIKNPLLIGDFLDRITDHKIEEAKKYIELGIKIGSHGDDLGTQNGPFFSLKTFREMIKPRLKRIFEVYKKVGLPIMMHSCGNITEYLPDLIEIGLDVLEPVQPCMDLVHLKREFGKDLTFMGGIDTQYVLPFGTEKEVRSTVRDVIRTLGKGGGYIISPSQEIMKDVPIRNIKALIETMIEERQNI